MFSVRLTTIPVMLIIVLMMSATVAAQQLIDPTRPSGFAMLDNNARDNDPGDATMRLQAIYFHPQKAAALINGRRFMEGDQLGQMTVLKIFPDRVVLADSASETELRLSIPAVITRPQPDNGAAGKE